MRPDVMVVGGGPAGSSAAIRLARAGVRVVLAERRREPHHKVCGEFLSGEALEDLLDLGLSPFHLGAVPIGHVAVAGRGRPVVRGLPFRAASLSRDVLDEALLQAAEAAGAIVLRGFGVRGLQEGEGHTTTVRLDGAEDIHASAVFVATGKHDLRGHPRPSGVQSDLIGLKMLFRRRRDRSDAPVTLVPFTGGYAGLQPVGDAAVNLCLLVGRQRFAEHGNDFGRLLESLCREAPEIARQVDGAEPLLPKTLATARIPCGYVRDRTDRHWWLGDQAAVIPSFAGDGIAIALESGRRAAETYIRGGTAEQFQRSLARTTAGPVARATAVSRLLVKPWFGRPAAALARVPGVVAAIARSTRVRPPG